MPKKKPTPKKGTPKKSPAKVRAEGSSNPKKNVSSKQATPKKGNMAAGGSLPRSPRDIPTPSLNERLDR